MATTGAQRARRQRRRAQQVGFVGLAAAVAMPALLFGSTIADIAPGFRLELGYLAGWVPWFLMGLGVLFCLPVAWSAGLDPASRLYPRARNAYAGWGVTLYLLGFMVAWQVSSLMTGISGA